MPALVLHAHALQAKLCDRVAWVEFHFVKFFAVTIFQ
jgi:hypothetical protein